MTRRHECALTWWACLVLTAGFWGAIVALCAR
jgi:uncharacterized membrane protein